MNASEYQKSLEMVARAIQRHGRAAVGFSGGKDSLVLKHLLNPLSKQIDFIWVNTGSMMPHMERFVRELGVIELRGNQTARFATAGLPVRIAPVLNTAAGRVEREPRQRLMLSDWYSCCYEVRCAPMRDYLKLRGITLFIDGQRFEDNFDTLGGGVSGIERLQPLWEWSGADVQAYIEAHQLELPEQYGQGYRDSIECWNCTATIDADRFAYLAKHHPQRWEALKPALAAIYGAANSEMTLFQKAVSAAALHEASKGTYPSQREQVRSEQPLAQQGTKEAS